MASSTSFLKQLDTQLEHILSDWNIYTTLLAVALASFFLYPIFFSSEPDIHPLLLARQSSASRVRQAGESAVYHSLEIPYGYYMRTGLDLKDLDAPKWKSGRDGDLRDIWKHAVRGPIDHNRNSLGDRGKLFYVQGNDRLREFELPPLTREINAIGAYINERNGLRVAIYLPNSVELLVAFFGEFPIAPSKTGQLICAAAVFHKFTPILIPPNQNLDTLVQIFEQAQPDVLLMAAGTIALEDLFHQYSNFKQVILVVEQANRHMDWSSPHANFSNQANFTVWHEIILDTTKSISSELFMGTKGDKTSNIVFAHRDYQKDKTQYQITEFSQAVNILIKRPSHFFGLMRFQNIVAAVAAQISVLPQLQKPTHKDLVLPLESLSDTWTFTLVLAALLLNSSLAITSVTGPKASFDTVFQSVSPTIIIASSTTIPKFYRTMDIKSGGIMPKFHIWKQARQLASGTMPKSLTDKSKMRLIYISHEAESGNSLLGPDELFNLKLLTGARVIYAFVCGKVAGAVSQTNIFDYRGQSGPSNHSFTHFGPPLSSVEIKLRETDGKFNDEKPTGQLVVKGPAVVGQETIVPQKMAITESYTLSYA